MKWHRINTSMLHSWYHLTHSVETWVDLLWFSLIDILVFGFMSVHFAGGSESAQALVLGIVLWEVVRISNYTVTVGILWEVWSKSFSSMFISPLTIWEFIIGQAFSGLIKAIVVMVGVAVISQLLFNFALWQLGWVLVPYFAILFVFAVAAGLFTLGLIMRFGTSIQSLAWGLIFLYQPISAIFYPVSVLPAALQPISYSSPITYVMESARQQLVTGAPQWEYIGLGLGLSFVYLLATSYFLHIMIIWSRRSGAFARMGN